MIQNSPRNFRVRVFAVIVASITFYFQLQAGAFGWQSEPPASPKLDQAINQSVDFLLSRQGTDGAWHSEHYGAMKQGAANTALVLYALSHLPSETLQTHSDAIDRATDFLLPGIEKQGCVANPEGSLDYPVYSTALILTANKRVGLKLKPDQIRRMVTYLLDSQCTKARGFTSENPNFGGWDILGPASTQGKTAGANVSVTFYVVEALSLVRSSQTDQRNEGSVAEDPGNIIQTELSAKLVKRIDAALVAASQWCQRHQSDDGGFCFTSERRSTLNKAGWTDKLHLVPNPYGSATCDGLGILLNVGETRRSEPAQLTLSWLTQHPGVDTVPGFKADVDKIGWPLGLRFYYSAALSRSLKTFDEKPAIATSNAVIKQLLETQLTSGAWKNESSHMRENDELIATPFGLIALLNCKSIVADTENR